MLSRVISLIPLNIIRILAYRKVLGYTIGENVRIGLKTTIRARNVVIGDNVFIGKKNVVICDTFEVGSDSKIISNNTIIGQSKFQIGSNSRIINNHSFDVWNNIYIGNGTWVAGSSSQFWTHGSLFEKDKDLSITILNNVYVGSAVLLAPGVYVESDNLISLGSVLSGKYSEKLTLIAGNKAKVVKSNVDWRANWI